MGWYYVCIRHTHCIVRNNECGWTEKLVVYLLYRFIIIVFLSKYMKVKGEAVSVLLLFAFQRICIYIHSFILQVIYGYCFFILVGNISSYCILLLLPPIAFHDNGSTSPFSWPLLFIFKGQAIFIYIYISHTRTWCISRAYQKRYGHPCHTLRCVYHTIFT